MLSSSIGIVQSFGQKRFELLRLFDRFTHFFTERFDTRPLPVKAVFQIGIVIIGFGQTLALLRRRFSRLLHFLSDLLLLLFDVTSLISHLLHLLVKLTGRTVLKFVPQLFHVLQGASSFGGGARHIAFLQRIAGLPCIIAGLFKLFRLLTHLRLVFRILHPLLQFFRVSQDLLLLVLQTFQLFLDLLAILFGLGFLQSGLQLLNPLIQIVLTTCQFTQPAKDLAVLAILRCLRLFAGGIF